MTFISALFSAFLVIPTIHFPKNCMCAFVFLIQLKMKLRWCLRPVLNWIHSQGLICDWVRDLTVPTHLGLNWRALCAPYQFMGARFSLLKFQMAPRLTLLMSSVSRKKEPRFACLSEAKASHSQRMWAEVSSSAPHLLHRGLSDSHIRWRCVLRVLCPVRMPVTALDCVLLKNTVRVYC